MPQRLQRRQRHRVRLAKRSDGGPAQGRDVPYGAERKRQVPRQAPHIGALAANDLELRRILVDLPQELERLDPHPPRLRQGGTVLSGELVSTLAPDLHRRIDRWRLLDLADEAPQTGDDLLATRPLDRRLDDLAVGIVRIPGFAPPHD